MNRAEGLGKGWFSANHTGSVCPCGLMMGRSRTVSYSFDATSRAELSAGNNLFLSSIGFLCRRCVDSKVPNLQRYLPDSQYNLIFEQMTTGEPKIARNRFRRQRHCPALLPTALLSMRLIPPAQES